MADWVVRTLILDGWIIIVVAAALLLESVYPLGKLMRKLFEKATASFRKEEDDERPVE